ncbi:MAG: ABC transporter permease subunit [Kangiellaceae bacterium]
MCDYFFPTGVSFIVPNSLEVIGSANQEHNLFTLVIQYFSKFFTYISHIFTGQLGISNSRGDEVIQEIINYLPASIELALVTLLFSLSLGLWLGTVAAKNKNKWQDKLILSATLIGYSLPIFWWAMLLVLSLSLWLGITPVASRIGFEYDIDVVTGFLLIDSLLSPHYALDAFVSVVQHLVLPVIVLGTIPLAVITRITRSSMIKTLSKDYIKNAIARGISSTSVTWKHALRNAFPPILTSLTLQISSLITGAIITESIFSWPGAGKWLLEAVYRRDFPVIHGGLLVTASIVIVIYALLEYLSMWLNPKLRDKQIS